MVVVRLLELRLLELFEDSVLLEEEADEEE